MGNLFYRHEPGKTTGKMLIAGLGAAIGIALLAWLTITTGKPLLMAGFGASTVLLFSAHPSPFSQPINVIGGHLFSMFVGIICVNLLPDVWWSIGISVGIAVSGMALLRISHPPAGGNPIIAFQSHSEFMSLLFPILCGAIILVIVAYLYHKIMRNGAYPIPPKKL